MQKGFTPLYFLIGIILIAGVVGGIYLLGIKKNSSQSLQQTSNQTSQISVQPTASSPKVVLLLTAWSLGTKIYSNPKIDITFEYPSSFEVEETDIQKANQEWTEKYKNDPNIRQPLYQSTFYTTFSTPGKPSDPVNQEICDNKMSVSVQKYDNSQNLSVYNFIADLYKTYPGDGRTETFDTYKKSLKPTNILQDGSYVFEGIVGEKPVKNVYFTNKGKVYTFELMGNCYTDGQYTPEANKVFENIIKSVKFL